MERAGNTLAQIAEWLEAQHGVKVSVATASRALDKIRTATPPPPPLDLGLEPEREPLTDDDELALMRKHFRRQAFDRNVATRDQQGAARLVVAIMKEQRERRRPTQPPADQPEPDMSTDWAPTFSVKKSSS